MTVEIAYKTFFADYPDILEVAQICEILGGVNRKTVYSLIQENKLTAKRFGKKYLITKLNLLQFLELV